LLAGSSGTLRLRVVMKPVLPASAFVSLTMLAVVVMTPAVGRAVNKSSPPSIAFEEGLLTVKATAVPHRQIVEDVAERLGFQLIVVGSLHERRSIDLVNVPWETALKKLLPANWAFVYERAAQGLRPVKVLVFPVSAPREAASAAPGATAPDAASSGRKPSDTSREQMGAVLAQLFMAEGQTMSPEAVEGELLQFIQSQDEDVRGAAVVGLLAHGGEGAVQILGLALDDTAPWVREMAVQALAEIGGEQARVTLRRALQDEDEDVRQAAYAALARLRGGSSPLVISR